MKSICSCFILDKHGKNKKSSEPESPEDCTLIYFIPIFLHGKGSSEFLVQYSEILISELITPN